MDKSTVGLRTVFGALLILTLGGILLHQITGYNYPATPASSFELNVLGDIYEAIIVIPAGLIGLLALRRGKAWGSLLIAGVAVHFAYNYAMMVTGRQNLWIFLWVAKVALAGTTLCLLWDHLPFGSGTRTKTRWAIVVYLALVLVIFSGMMGQRLMASATGRTMEMTMEGSAAVDWGNPVLRDPIVFLAFGGPLFVAAVLGLARGTVWGGRAAALCGAFGASMGCVVLFTGPLKEYLMTGTISAGVWKMSVVIALATIPAVWSLVWLTKSGKGSVRIH